MKVIKNESANCEGASPFIKIFDNPIAFLAVLLYYCINHLIQ